MMLTNLRHTIPWFALLSLLSLALTACTSDGGGDQTPVNVVNIGGGDAGVQGCIQPTFPADQPDLSVVRPPNSSPTTTMGRPRLGLGAQSRRKSR